MTERVEAYARALLEIAEAEGLLAEIEDELFRFARTFEANDDLRLALIDPALPATNKVAIIEQLLGAKALITSEALALLVVTAGHAGELEAIVDEFVRLAASKREHVVAEVRSAVPLSDDAVARLTDALANATKKNVEVRVVIDPEVMGGIVTRMGDLVIDGTVRHRLDQLREQL